MQLISAAIASLPCLEELGLRNLPVGMQEATKLAAAAAATQLTQLQLEDCSGLDDCSLNTLALGLTNLKSLDLEDCEVGDGALPVLARQPLQRLRFEDCQFTQAGLNIFIPGWRDM
jgi:hypothetical protein